MCIVSTAVLHHQKQPQSPPKTPPASSKTVNNPMMSQPIPQSFAQSYRNSSSDASSTTSHSPYYNQIGHFLKFQVSTHRLTSQHRAVNITPVRTKQVARIESTKGEYGFISFKVDEKDHQASLTKNGANSLPQNTGNLFFHSSELVGCAMFELQVGDVVEFNVVHNKRTNKYCAAKVRFIERKPEIMATSEIVEKSNVLDKIDVEATEMTSLPGVRQILRREAENVGNNNGNRVPFMRKISQTDVNGVSGFSEVNNSSPKNVPGSPNPRVSISSNNGNSNNNVEEKQKQQQQQPGTPTEDKRPERIARFKKNSINVGESLLRGENQTTRQPTTGNTEIKVGSSNNPRKR